MHSLLLYLFAFFPVLCAQVRQPPRQGAEARYDSSRKFYSRFALLLLAVPTLAHAGSTTQPDVALVRAEGSPSAEVVTRLPINTPVQIVDPTPTSDGYISIKVYNNHAMSSSVPAGIAGYIHASLLGPPVTAKGLEAQLATAPTPEDRLTLLERLVALRGDVADHQRLLTEAAIAGDTDRVARAQQYLKPAPAVVGVCFGGRVAILAEIRDGVPVSLVDEFENSTRDSPEVLKSVKRLRAYGLQLTTVPFYAHNASYWPETQRLLLPSVVTTEDVMSTMRNYIDLGPCPVLFGEVETRPATVFSTQKIVPRLPDVDLTASELIPLVKAMGHDLNELIVMVPGGGLVELNTPSKTMIFDRKSGSARACSNEVGCSAERITHTEKPAWAELESGYWMRIGSMTEAVTAAGWGSPDNAGQWVSPRFVIQLYKGQKLSSEQVVTLAEYGC